jgi:hypothetical protein
MARYISNSKLAFRLHLLLLLSALLMLVAFVLNRNHSAYAIYFVAAGVTGLALHRLIFYIRGEIKTTEGITNKKTTLLGSVRYVHWLLIICIVVVALLLPKNRVAAIYLINIALIGIVVFFFVLMFRNNDNDNPEKNTPSRQSATFSLLIKLFAAVVIIGLLFLVDHIPYGIYLIDAGLVGNIVLVITLPFSIKARAQAAKDDGEKMKKSSFGFNFLLVLFTAIAVLGLLFKINRLPYSEILLSTGSGGVIMLLIIIIILAEIKKSKKTNV